MRYRQVLRRLAHSPGFTAIAVLTLALGIGANSAVFSVLEGVLLKPLPYPDPEELISVGHSAKGINVAELGIAPFLYFTYREQNRTLRDIGMWDTRSSSVTGLAEPEQINVLLVSDAILPLLGISPTLGRWFSGRDDSPGTPETALLMYGYWQSRFGGDRSVVGRWLMGDGRPREIIGVMPARFHFLDYHPALILPFRFDRGRAMLGGFGFQALTRLRPGVNLSQDNADAARMIPIGLDSFPPFPGYTKQMFEGARLAPNIRPLKQDVIGSIAGSLWLVMGTIGLVLLIACANVANLLLVRADARQRELAIRSALGAGWRTIAGDLMAESLILGVSGGGGGSRLGVRRAALAGAHWAGQPAAPRRDRHRRLGAALHPGRFAGSGAAVRRHSGVEICRTASGCGAARRRPHLQPKPRDTPLAQRADGGTGSAGAGPAGQRGFDNPFLPGLASCAARFHAPGVGRDHASLHS